MRSGFAARVIAPVPRRRDIWQVDVSLPPRPKPRGGKLLEPPGVHPAIVLTDAVFNGRGLAIAAFMSSDHHDPAHSVELAADRKAGADGFVYPHKVYALDWEARFVARMGVCPQE